AVAGDFPWGSSSSSRRCSRSRSFHQRCAPVAPLVLPELSTALPTSRRLGTATPLAELQDRKAIHSMHCKCVWGVPFLGRVPAWPLNSVLARVRGAVSRGCGRAVGDARGGARLLVGSGRKRRAGWRGITSNRSWLLMLQRVLVSLR